MGDSTDNSLLEPFRNLRLLGAGDVADNTRPANLSPATRVGQEAPVLSGAGAQISLSGSVSMSGQSVAAAIPPSGPPTVPRPRKPERDAKKSRSSFEPPKVSSTPESSDNGDSDDDAGLLAVDMSLTQKVEYAALRRQLNRARRRGDMHQVQLTQQLITQLVALAISSASTADNASSSGSVGRSSHVSEKLQMHNSFVPKEVLNKIMDVQDTSVGQPAVSPSSAHVRDEASDAAAAAILASQMGPKFGPLYLALIRTVQRARRRGYMGEAAAYESLLSRMEAMAGVSSSIASVSAGTALLPTTARPATFVPMQEAPDSVPLPAAEISASFGVVVLREVLPCDTGADIVPAPAVSASSMECASSVGTGVVSPPDDGGSQICADPSTHIESGPALLDGCGDACFALVRDCAPIEPLPGTQPLRLSPPSDKEAHFDSSTASAIEAPAVCESHELGAVVLATLAAPLTVWPSKVLAVNSVSFLADALQTLLLAAICSALASSACVAFAVSGSVAVEFIDSGFDPPVLVCC
jgi:hypothetical protein